MAPPRAAADAGHSTGGPLRVSLHQDKEGTTATLEWEGAGVPEQSTNLLHWREVAGEPLFPLLRQRSITLELGTRPPASLYFRLRLPDRDEDDHTHIINDNLFPYRQGQLAQLIDPLWTLSRRQPVHRIRLHAIRTADSNGDYAATVTADEIEELVEQTNTIFYRAGVEFAFDPATDLEDVRDTNLNRDVRAPQADTAYSNSNSNPTQLGVTSNDAPARARAARALQHRGKLVVFFRWQRDGWDWNGSHWTPRRSGMGFSSWASTHVTMPARNIGINHLAHEIGHYLQNMHTFADEYSKSEAEDKMEAAIASGSVTAANALEVFNGDAYWVRDTPPDPSQKAFPGDGCSTATITLNVDTDPGPGVSMTAYTAAPDRLNLMSYFGDCTELGVRRLSSEMMDRLRDGLENSFRHPLISQHIDGIFAPALSLRDTWGGGTADTGIQLLRTRWDQLGAVHRTASGNLRLASLHMDDQGVLTTQTTLNTGSACDSVAAVNMGLGLVAIGLGRAVPEYRIYRMSEAGNWSHLSTWIPSPLPLNDSANSPIAMTRLGRLNFASAYRSQGGRTLIRLFETDAHGYIRHQDLHRIAEGTQHSLGMMRGKFLILAMRDAAGNLDLRSFRQTGERGANELEQAGQAGAGAITTVSLVGCEHDRFVTAVRTGSGALKLIPWEVDYDGAITRLANGTDGPDNLRIVGSMIGSDLVATVARTPNDALSVKLWEWDGAGTFTDRITNDTEVQSANAFDSPAVQLMRDRYLAVARRLSSGSLEIRSYRFTP